MQRCVKILREKSTATCSWGAASYPFTMRTMELGDQMKVCMNKSLESGKMCENTEEKIYSKREQLR